MPITSDYWGANGFGRSFVPEPIPETIRFRSVTDWRYEKLLTFSEMAEIFRQSLPQGYNGFHIDDLSIYQDELASCGDLRYQIAREGSVAIYVHSNAQSFRYLLRTVFHNCSADEIDWVDDHILRVWWD